MKEVNTLIPELVQANADAWSEFDLNLKSNGFTTEEKVSIRAEIEALYESSSENKTHKLLRGIELLFGIGADQALEEGFGLIKAVAESDQMMGNYYLGYCYAQGRGTLQDLTIAKQYYAKAFSQGHLDSGLEWAIVLYNQKELDVAELVAFESKVKTSNKLKLIAAIGLFCEKSLVSDNNLNEALKWYRLGAELGDPDSQCRFAHLVEVMELEDLEQKRAVKFLEQAAAKDNAQALYELGKRTAIGLGTRKNVSTALGFFLSAMELDNAPAMYKVAHAYQTGNGVEQNRAMAVQLYFEHYLKTGSQKSLEQLHAISETNGEDTASEHALAYLFLTHLMMNGAEADTVRAEAVYELSQNKKELMKIIFNILTNKVELFCEDQNKLNVLLLSLFNKYIDINFKEYDQEVLSKIFPNFIKLCEVKIQSNDVDSERYWTLLEKMVKCEVPQAAQALESCIKFKVKRLSHLLNENDGNAKDYLEALDSYRENYKSKEALHVLQKYYAEYASQQLELALQGSREDLVILKDMAKFRPEADVSLGIYYLRKAKAVNGMKNSLFSTRKKLHDKAYIHFLKALSNDSENADAIYQLANCYADGISVERDPTKAISLYFNAYQKGKEKASLKKIASYQKSHDKNTAVLANLYLGLAGFDKLGLNNKYFKAAMKLSSEYVCAGLKYILQNNVMDGDKVIEILSHTLKHKLKAKDKSELTQMLKHNIIDKIAQAEGAVETYDMDWVKQVDPNAFVQAVLHVLSDQSKFHINTRASFLFIAIRIAKQHKLKAALAELREFEPSHASARQFVVDTTKKRLDTLFFKSAAAHHTARSEQDQPKRIAHATRRH